jgi:predicted metal-dependent hydrolase
MPVLPGPPPLDITLRRSTRARRFSLRVSALDGRVTLSVPQRAREADAMDFARSHEAWLRAALARRAVPNAIGFGSFVPIEGREVLLAPGSGRAARREGDSLFLPGASDHVAARAGAWLRTLARDRLAEASDHYAGLLGCKVTRIALRDTRSRWGSCSHEGALMYSWRLVMAPPSVLRYVAAHECAHLVEMNHAPAFWAVVARLYPGWQAERAWLHANGARLHSYRFGA